VGDLLVHEPFDDIENWRPEGNLKASAEDGCLFIECGDANEDRGNVWSRRSFSGPLYFEFRFRKLSGRAGLNLIFWNARSVEGADFFSISRHWEMSYVIDGNQESYHISYARGNTGVTNFHKNPGFHDFVQDVDDPLKDPGEEWHDIGVYQNGGHTMFYEDGQLVHDVDETVDFPGGSCLRDGPHTSWRVPGEDGSMCPGLDAQKVYTNVGEAVDIGGEGRRYTYDHPRPGEARTYTSGHIGFRHQNGVTLYDDLRVWSLEPPVD
jgi:hypothetical protein